MQIIKFRAVNLQTALRRGAVYWVQQDGTCQVSCFMRWSQRPDPESLALGS